MLCHSLGCYKPAKACMQVCSNTAQVCCMIAAVLGQHDDVVMVDLEQQYWPWLWWPGWPPLAIWVHVILTLENADTTRAGTHANDCLQYVVAEHG